ncbi:MAG TPA: hypothetical protein VHU18_13140 [Rhizomicrobium sp.]|nr:hypothetical protein [Rhizomicrobium sp.]
MRRQPARNNPSGFLAELMASLRDAQTRPGISAEERGRHQRWLEQAAVLQTLLESRQRPAAPAARAVVPREAAEKEALPPALLKELSPRTRDQLEQQILSVLAAGGGSADLDQVLIGLYRGFGLIAKRRVIQNKLWRLVRTGRITKAKNTRNVFSLDAPLGGNLRRKRKQ